MGNDAESESRKQKAIRFETRFVLISTPALAAISFALYLWTDLSFWFVATPAIGFASGLLYLLWTTRLGQAVNDTLAIADLLYRLWPGVCVLIDLAGWIIGAVGALIAIGWIR